MAKTKPEYHLESRHFAMMSVAATKGSRYSIDGLRLEPPGRAVVTDGRRLLVSRVRADVGVPELLIGPDEYKLARKMRAIAGLETVTVSGDAQTLAIQANTLTTTRDLHGDVVKYPCWRDVVPKEEPETRILVNAKLLGELLLAIAAQFESGPAGIVCLGLPKPATDGGCPGPIVLWTPVKETAQCLGLLMPCSDTYEPSDRTWQRARAAFLDDVGKVE